MDLYTKIDNFNKRWKLMDDESLEDGFKKFKIRVLNILKYIDSYVSSASISTFCLALGIQENYNDDGFNIYSDIIINAFKHENDIVKFFRMIEIVFNLDFITHNRNIGSYWQVDFFNKIREAFNFSNISARIEKIDGDILILPTGEKLLDEEVVDQVLNFLDGDALIHFIEALKDYEQDTEKSRVNSVDHLRRSLEEQLKKELDNGKGLQNNKIVFSRKLKSMGVNNNIRKIVSQLINSLDDLFNKDSKHEDGNFSETENEYLIYQIALLMRYIHKILMD